MQLKSPNASTPQLRVLILYDEWTAQTAAVREQLMAFRRHSACRVAFAIGSRGAAGERCGRIAVALTEQFDVIVVHHSVRLYVETYISPAWASALAAFEGCKVLFVQDDYEGTETTRRWIERLGFDLLFTVVPEAFWEQVYPKTRFPKLRIEQVLTGYVPEWAEQRRHRKPLIERARLIGYRAFKLPWRFGDLAREKYLIGRRMRELCDARGVATDIEWEPDKRIYGTAWYDFIEDCRATLGTESGSNVFDDHGEIERAIDEALLREPGLSYEQVHERFLSKHEGRIRMNQISPRIFEAVALGSALLLFEGEYSGVVRPHEHFIPLKKDFSNLDEALAKLSDIPALEAMTARAYDGVIASGRYGFKEFVARFDSLLQEQAKRRTTGGGQFWLSPGGREESGEFSHFAHDERQLWLTQTPFLSDSHTSQFFNVVGSKYSTDAGNQLTSELERANKEDRFLRSELARFTSRNAELREARDLAMAEAESWASVNSLLSALAEWKHFALVRLLGLVGPLPELRKLAPAERVNTIVQYIEGTRWLAGALQKRKHLRKLFEKVKNAD